MYVPWCPLNRSNSCPTSTPSHFVPQITIQAVQQQGGDSWTEEGCKMVAELLGKTISPVESTS